MALLALCVVRGAGTEPRNASHALVAGRRRLSDAAARREHEEAGKHDAWRAAHGRRRWARRCGSAREADT